MACIEQLQIAGIRSFNPDTSARQSLRFHKPVTIILGPNGCGKTTVIESLRNACTGELPVNTGKGAAFIHDPKVAGETEVKAQIRLQFRTNAGQQMLIGRSYQLTQSSSEKQKFETLDVSLQTRDPKTGQIVSQSYKCSDIDKLVPDLLGISKPILDNVIFLHQDDTNWPLSDARTLKKRFDEIFSSTRYTKALEELRRIGKDNRDKIKEHIANLAVFKQKREQAHLLRAQVEDTQKKITSVTEQIRSIDGVIGQVQAQINETGQQAEEIQQLESDTIKLQGQVEALVHQRETLGRSLAAVSEETDEKLEEALQKFDGVFDSLKHQRNEAEQRARSLSTEIREADGLLMRIRSEREFLLKQRSEHEGRMARLQGMLRGIASASNLQLSVDVEHHFDESAVLQLYDTLVQKLEELKRQREKERSEARWAQEDVERQMSGVRQRRDQMLAELKALESKNEQSRPKLRDLKDRYNALSAADKEQGDADQHLARLEQQLGEKRGEEEAVGSRLSVLREEHTALQVQSDALRADAQSRRDEQQAAHKLRLLREQRESFGRDEASVKQQLEDGFQRLAGRKPHANFKEDVRAAVDQKQAAVAKVQKQATECDRELAIAKQQVAQLSQRHMHLEAEVKLKEDSYAPLQQKHNKALPELLTKAVTKEEKERKTVASMEALQLCHERFKETAEEERCCPICARDMTESELSVMAHTMQQKLREVPATIAAKRDTLEKTQRLVHEVRRLLPVHSDVQRLRDEVQKLDEQQAKARDTFEIRTESLRGLTAKLDALAKEAKDFEGLLHTADRVKELQASARGVEESIRGEETKIAAQYGEGVRPLDLVEREIDEVQSRMTGLVREQQNLMATLERQRSESTLLGQQVQQQQRLLDGKKAAVEERARVKVQYESLHEEYTRGNNTCADIKATLAPAEQQLAAHEQELLRRREEGDRKEAEITSHVEERQEGLSRIAAIVGDVKRHLEENTPERVVQLEQRLREFEERQQHRGHEKEMLEAKASELLAKLSKQDQTRRELEANLQYRTVCREVRSGESQLAQLRKVISERTRGHEGVWASLDKLRAQKSEHEKERAMFAGQMHATENLLNERQTELQSIKYDRIDERYNSTLIRLTTAQLADDDLGKYSQALDKALMKYHDEKITEVNEVIRDLWVRTYRGNDIDHVELRSDVEASTTRRNYNYRVVMVKNGVALDMRGRCSAGQKVLASLVVRIALSQAFCCDCGILALDEPTTNLDIENIDSLAYALTELIEARKLHQNFQLIIITHDEQFVRRIGRVCGTETVYHITKSVDGQYSTITERDFAEFT